MKGFWRELCSRFEFEPHDLERLRTACEQIDLIDGAQAAIGKDGHYVLDRYKALRAHPAIAVSKDAWAMLLRALRELAVDVDPPDDPPRLPKQERMYK